MHSIAFFIELLAFFVTSYPTDALRFVIEENDIDVNVTRYDPEPPLVYFPSFICAFHSIFQGS